MKKTDYKMLELFDSLDSSSEDYFVELFSHNNFSSDVERRRLEQKYIGHTEETIKFSRRTVSFQASKNASVHSWLKYKEGFSSDLVEILIKEFELKDGNVVFDPFVGSGTTLLVSKLFKLKSFGFDILPTSELALKVKNQVKEIDISEVEEALDFISNSEVGFVPYKLNYLNITKGAYSESIEQELEFFTFWNENSKHSEKVKNLIKLALVNILEEVSFTAKDGQYLRWDYRSTKVINTNRRRVSNNREPLKTVLNKGEIPTVRESLINAIRSMIRDISSIQKNSSFELIENEIEFKQGSVLFELPKIIDVEIDAVITSPPYCNRYDYTRTYALELSYLGVGELELKKMRQELLTCTVENRPKIESLRKLYIEIGKLDDFLKVSKILEENLVLREINTALANRSKVGEVNNSGIITMVNNYFVELTFLFFELFRLSKQGAKIAIVNDNVRYAGEIIPVDFLMCELAEKIGFKVKKVYVLKQRKGNSSQQMKKYGRIALRKSITIWEKP